MQSFTSRVINFVRNRWKFFLWGPLRDEQREQQVQMLQQQLQSQQAQIQQVQMLQQQLQSQQAQIRELIHHLRLDRARPDAARRDAFYLAFEAEFRGGFDDVQQRMQAHRQWIDQAPAGTVADLGCGRGEWLQLLRQWGRASLGVDLNALNVQSLREQGLAVEHADVIDWLLKRANDELAAVSAFHLAEHLSFDDLMLLFQQVQRVLMPGGVFILETPNPENLEVASHTFWLDPTHVRPLPPGLLDLLARSVGLEVITLARLNAPAHDPGPLPSQALQRLMTEGRDIALVARKPRVSG